MDISKILLKNRLFRHLLYGGRQSFTLLCGAFIFLSSATVNADLCDAIIDQAVSQDTVDQVAFYRNELFDEPAYHGSEAWNRIILECNRRRDTKGSEIKNALTGGGSDANKELLKRKDLQPKVIRGHYNFRGNVAFQQKYRYVLSKEDGKWTMIIPYKAIINDIVKDRIDFYIGRRYIGSDVKDKGDDIGRFAAWKLYEESEVIPGIKQTGPDNAPVARKAPQDALDDLFTYRLKPTAEPIAQTLCEDSTFFPGKEHRYDGKSDENSNKRDKENKHISTGKIQYRHHRSTWKLNDWWEEGCRVKKDIKLYLQEDPNNRQVVEINPADWILDNFISVAEKYWSTPDNFTLRILLKDYNDDSFDEDIVALLDDSDYLTVRFATKFMPYKNNQMYKSNIAQFNNFSTMTTDGTYFHEVGHALSLGDEYGKDATKKSCHHSYYADYGTNSYQMCGSEVLETRTIYHFIAVSHYLTAQNECTDDSQCEVGKWCDKGVGLQKNQCRPLLNDGSSCPLVNGGHACRSGHCEFGQCYTPNSVAIGGHCFVNDQCRQGQCNNITDGTGGTCVCDDDEQCGGGRYCDMGADFRRNTCRNLKADNEACALFNGGRTCQSGLCDAGRCYTPDSVPIGGTCYVGAACSKGKCNNAVNGTKGTCVCDSDNDCDSGYWCDRGLDLSNNSCKRKYAEGEICGKVGELNVGHRCLSGKCKAAGLINLKCKE